MNRVNAFGTEHRATKVARDEGPTLKERLEALVVEMVDRGILFEDAVAEFERHYIGAVLARNGGNLSRTAEELRIHRNTLRKRLQEFAGPVKAREATRRSRRATK